MCQVLVPFGPPSDPRPISLREGYKAKEMSTQVDTGTIMGAPKYTLPPPVYLPSSGGYTSSRLTQEVSASSCYEIQASTHTSRLAGLALPSSCFCIPPMERGRGRKVGV